MCGDLAIHLHRYQLYDLDTLLFNCQRSKLESLKLNVEQCSTPNLTLPKNGGGERDRTDDLLRARQALSQLSYTPNPYNQARLVGLGGLEPPTSRLSGVRSNQAEL